MLGQVVLKFFLEPLQEYKGVRGEVAHALTFYANVAGDEHRGVSDEARKHLRGLAAKLTVSLHKIPWYGVFTALGMVPKRVDLLKASSDLIGWSNNFRAEWEGTTTRREDIARCLGIPAAHNGSGVY